MQACPRPTLALPRPPAGVRRHRPGLAWLAALAWCWAAAPASASPAPNGSGVPSRAWPAPLAQALQQSGLPAEAVSLLVWPVDAAQPRWQHQADAPRQAASVMKLFTTGVALRQLGPAHVWRTEAGLGGALHPDGTLDGPLWLRGGGDPSLLIEQVQRMVARWRGAGLRDIRGGIVIDRSAFELPAHDPAAFDGEALKPYNAGPDALLLNHQAVTLRLMPDAARPGQALATLEPPLQGVQLQATLGLAAAPSPTTCGDWKRALQLGIERQAGEPTSGRSTWLLRLTGTYPAACGEKEWHLLWQGDGPGDHAARLLEAAWRGAGGRIGGAPVREGLWPAGLAPWQTWVSPPLASVVRDINKFSNNVMARQLFLTLALGSEGRGPATLAQARSTVTQAVQAATSSTSSTAAPGLAASPCLGDALVLDNGSGLSRQEHTSARCLAQWLQAMWHSPVMPEFIASLPLNGVDGTTRRWQAAAGQAHIKTGSLDGVASVAGYVRGESGQRIVVIGLVNHPRADAARALLQALIDWARQDR